MHSFKLSKQNLVDSLRQTHHKMMTNWETFSLVRDSVLNNVKEAVCKQLHIYIMINRYYHIFNCHLISAIVNHNNQLFLPDQAHSAALMRVQKAMSQWGDGDGLVAIWKLSLNDYHTTRDGKNLQNSTLKTLSLQN